MRSLITYYLLMLPPDEFLDGKIDINKIDKLKH